MVRNLRKRSGFTLLELLIVIAIIAILLGLSMSAVMRVHVNQEVRSSSTTVEKLQVAIDAQYKAIIAQAQIDIRNGGSNQEAQAMINIMQQDTDAALALLTYCRVRQSFPQTFAEVGPFNVCGYYTFPVKTQFAAFAGASSGSLTPSQQSGALLYAAVSQTGAGGQSFASDETLNGNQLDFVQAGAPTIHVYMDSWMQPIGFARFGTNKQLQAPPYSSTTNFFPNTNTLMNDPLDPSGKLWLWGNTLNPGLAKQAAAVLFLNNGDIANATFFDGTNRRPIVYSIGPNRTYESLNMVPAGPEFSNTFDDILGYQLAQLGQTGLR